MGRDSLQTPLVVELATFQERIRSLAMEAVRSVIRQELQCRIDAITATMAPPKSRTRSTTHQGVGAGAPTQASKPAVDLARDSAANQKRRWTRDAIVSELARWLVSGTTIDASFVTRHGPPGLVAATRKEFGRFDAALNVASLKVSELYPDGPPTASAHR